MIPRELYAYTCKVSPNRVIVLQPTPVEMS